MFTINDLSVIADATQRMWESTKICRIELGPLVFLVMRGHGEHWINRVDPANERTVITVRVTANLTELQRKNMGGKRLTGFAVIDMGRNVIVAEVDDDQIRDALGAGLVAAMVALP